MAGIQSPGSERRFECVEIYVPKKLEHLSELYNYLRKKLADRKAGIEQEVPIDGFSLYEVDGAFYGTEVYQERTVVVRILMSQGEDESEMQRKINSLGREVAETVAIAEEELWIAHYPQGILILKPSLKSGQLRVDS